MTTTFITAVGRRKTAIASVRMAKAAKSSVMVNGKHAKEYFKTDERAKVAQEALSTAESAEHYAVIAHVEGGGIAAQADALRHAISRALIKAEPNTRKVLKAAKFLRRDPRAKERKKPGLVKARKAKQWSKR
ncbi:MAG: 30S ribosomal protein S9 [Minisyncoccota bacterium]